MRAGYPNCFGELPGKQRIPAFYRDSAVASTDWFNVGIAGCHGEAKEADLRLTAFP